MRREALAVGGQGRAIEALMEHASLVAGIEQAVALEIHPGVATIGMALTIDADTIDRRHVAEVFDGPSLIKNQLSTTIEYQDLCKNYDTAVGLLGARLDKLCKDSDMSIITKSFLDYHPLVIAVDNAVSIFDDRSNVFGSSTYDEDAGPDLRVFIKE